MFDFVFLLLVVENSKSNFVKFLGVILSQTKANDVTVNSPSTVGTTLPVCAADKLHKPPL